MTEPARPRPEIKRFEYDPSWRRRWSVAAVTSFVLGVLLTGLLVIVKTLGPIWTTDGSGDRTLEAGQLGGILLMSIFPASAAVVFGRVAVVHTWGDRLRGWMLGALGLGLGAVHVLLWGNRVLNAVIATGRLEDMYWFVPNLFWWT